MKEPDGRARLELTEQPPAALRSSPQEGGLWPNVGNVCLDTGRFAFAAREFEDFLRRCFPSTYVHGFWSEATNIDTSTSTKTYPSLPSSIDASSKVVWPWDQGGTSPREVKIARAPKSEELAVPLGVVAATVLLPRLARRSCRTARGADA